MRVAELGDRMKLYEKMATPERVMPLLPVLARVDGRNFHSFVRGLRRPYDETLSRMMIDTALYLLKETNAVMAYTQSDEITLCWQNDRDRECFFGGKVQKMISHLAAMTSVHFYKLCFARLPLVYSQRNPTFDCRVWSVPSCDEAANAFLWREIDATKNSIYMVAQEHYSHRELHGKSSSEKQEMLWKKGVNWNDYPAFFKRGVFLQKKTVSFRFRDHAEAMADLPPLHFARQNPDQVYTRLEYMELDMPPFRKVMNRAGVIFGGNEPQAESERGDDVDSIPEEDWSEQCSHPDDSQDRVDSNPNSNPNSNFIPAEDVERQAQKEQAEQQRVPFDMQALQPGECYVIWVTGFLSKVVAVCTSSKDRYGVCILHVMNAGVLLHAKLKSGDYGVVDVYNESRHGEIVKVVA